MTKPKPEGPIEAPPELKPESATVADTAAALDQQAQRILEMAQGALLNLQTAREQAEAQLDDLQRRVESGKEGAEMVAVLHDEIKKALKVEQQIQQQITKLDQKIETAHKKMEKISGSSPSQ